ncbi:MAG: hypothetical protein Q9163_002766 [Psora crenata]
MSKFITTDGLPAPSHCSTILFLDWDSTLTTASTLPLIASIATYPAQHPKLSDLVGAYSEDWKVHDSSYRPPKPDRTTLEQEYAYLNSFRRVENASIRRIEDACIFKGITAEDARCVAVEVVNQGAVGFRDGWEQCLAAVKKSSSDAFGGSTICIVSVAWSSTFIRACLDATAGSNLRSLGDDVPPLNSPGMRLEDVRIYANDMHSSGSGKLTGPWPDVDRLILTAADKLEIMRAAVSSSKTSGLFLEPRTVYMGDSLTDLACLMDADVGICLRDQDMTGEQEQLKETLYRLNVEVKWIREYKGGQWMGETHPESTIQGKILWWARDFLEVVQSDVVS